MTHDLDPETPIRLQKFDIRILYRYLGGPLINHNFLSGPY